MWWLIPVFGLALGAYFGQYLDIEIPAGMVKYFSIGIMAALDSVFGGIKALYEKNYDSLLMLSGFFTNALLAAALAYIGDMLGIDLYYAAVFAFGVRLFSNLSMIRVYIVGNLREKDRFFREHRRVMDRVAAVRADDEDDEYDDEDDEDDGENDAEDDRKDEDENDENDSKTVDDNGKDGGGSAS